MKLTITNLRVLSVLVLLLAFIVPLARAQEEPPAPRVVNDKNAPEGWKRYQFAFNGGDTLSVFLPSEPREYAGKGQVAADVMITMMTRTFSANTKSASYTAFYADSLSVPAERMTEKQKAIFYDAMWGSFTKGAVRAFREAGQNVEAKGLEKRKVTVSGREGIEQDFSVGLLEGRARMVLAGQFAYMVIAMWRQGTADAQVAAFFRSFDIRTP